jgi:hypothetical protein
MSLHRTRHQKQSDLDTVSAPRRRPWLRYLGGTFVSHFENSYEGSLSELARLCVGRNPDRAPTLSGVAKELVA